MASTSSTERVMFQVINTETGELVALSPDHRTALTEQNVRQRMSRVPHHVAPVDHHAAVIARAARRLANLDRRPS